MTLDNEQLVRKAYQIAEDLALHGTHLGPLDLPIGTVRPTGKRMDAPCCDVFELVDGKIKRFDCYPEGSIILTPARRDRQPQRRTRALTGKSA